MNTASWLARATVEEDVQGHTKLLGHVRVAGVRVSQGLASIIGFAPAAGRQRPPAVLQTGSVGGQLRAHQAGQGSNEWTNHQAAAVIKLTDSPRN